MITNQLLYQLSYTGMGLFSNEDRRKKEVAEGMGLISNLLHVGNELESRRVQPARRGIFLR